MGDPRSHVRNAAAALVVGAYFGGGQCGSAEEALKSEFARQRDEDSPLVAMNDALEILRIHRRLGTKPPSDIVAWLTTNGQAITGLSPEQKLGLERALVLAGGDMAKADDLLRRLEARNKPAADLQSLPLLRLRKNDKRVVEIVRRCQERAVDWQMRDIAIDAALSLEAAHAEPKEIRDVLRYLRSPNVEGVNVFDVTIAEAILARVSDGEGKTDEAAMHRENLAKRLSKADRGIADFIAKLR
jgi:hypothetical protein